MRIPSGLILDVYDDTFGQQIKDLFPTPGDLPEQIKTAEALSSEDRERLPDSVFALVVTDGEHKLRKYACLDEGTTMLSALYFVKNAHKLPAEVQGKTAENLLTACSWYGLEQPEELSKLAMGVMNALMLPMTIAGTGGQIKQNLQAAKASGGTVNPSVQHGMVHTAALEKQADLSGTQIMPNSGGGKMHKSQVPVKKTAAFSHAPDVSTLSPPTYSVEKKASRFALGGRYPLDSYAQVKTAAAYFDQYQKHFQPAERHEFCTNLVKRACELSIPISEDAKRYGSEGLGPVEQVKLAFETRRALVTDQQGLDFLAELEKLSIDASWDSIRAADGKQNWPTEKRASVGDPEILVRTLAEFDKVAGLDHLYDIQISDPYFSLLGFHKTAEDDWSEFVGDKLVTTKDLKDYAKTKYYSLKTTFGAELANEFRKDPVGIFKSLPMDQKKMIANMATDNSPGHELTT